MADLWNRPVPKPKCTYRVIMETNDPTVVYLEPGESYWLLDSPRQMLLWPTKIEKIGGDA